MPPLDGGDAVELFVERARLVRPGFDLAPAMPADRDGDRRRLEGCRSPWSWPPPGSGCSRPSASSSGSAARSTSRRRRAGPARAPADAARRDRLERRPARVQSEQRPLPPAGVFSGWLDRPTRPPDRRPGRGSLGPGRHRRARVAGRQEPAADRDRPRRRAAVHCGTPSSRVRRRAASTPPEERAAVRATARADVPRASPRRAERHLNGSATQSLVWLDLGRPRAPHTSGRRCAGRSTWASRPSACASSPRSGGSSNSTSSCARAATGLDELLDAPRRAADRRERMLGLAAAGGLAYWSQDAPGARARLSTSGSRSRNGSATRRCSPTRTTTSASSR